MNRIIALLAVAVIVIASDSLKVDTVKAVKDMYQEQKTFNEDLRSIRAYLRAKKDSTIIDSTIIDTVK